MSEEKVFRALQEYKQALFVVFGIASSLLVITLAGDLHPYLYGAPFGWFALWLITTVGSIPLGVVMLIGRWWRHVPLVERRKTAMGFLLVGLVNFISLALHLSWTVGVYVFVIPLIYGLMLIPVYARVFAYEDREKEELFP